MSTVFSSEPLWGYTKAHPRRYRAGTVTVVLFPPDAPRVARRLLHIQRFSGPLFALTWCVTAIAGATLILVEAAVVLALALAAATSNALHRSTRPARRQTVSVDLRAEHECDLGEERRRLLDAFLATAYRRPRTRDELRRLHALWRQLYDDLRSSSSDGGG